MLRRFIKFGVVGGVGTAVNLGVLYLCTDIANIQYLLSYCISFTCSVTNNYLLNSLWTFNRFRGARGYVFYVCVSLTTLGLSTGLLYLLTDVVGIFYVLSAMVTIILVFPINFLLSHRYVWVQ